MKNISSWHARRGERQTQLPFSDILHQSRPELTRVCGASTGINTPQDINYRYKETQTPGQCGDTCYPGSCWYGRGASISHVNGPASPEHCLTKRCSHTSTPTQYNFPSLDFGIQQSTSWTKKDSVKRFLLRPKMLCFTCVFRDTVMFLKLLEPLNDGFNPSSEWYKPISNNLYENILFMGIKGIGKHKRDRQLLSMKGISI